MSTHPKFKNLTPHSPAWRVLRRDEMQRRRKIRGADGNERLAPGRLPDPNLERCLRNLTTLITEREYKAFMRSKPKGVTVSTWVRAMICEGLERRRVKHGPTMAFSVDLKGSDAPRALARGGA